MAAAFDEAARGQQKWTVLLGHARITRAGCAREGATQVGRTVGRGIRDRGIVRDTEHILERVAQDPSNAREVDRIRHMLAPLDLADHNLTDPGAFPELLLAHSSTLARAAELIREALVLGAVSATHGHLG